MPTCLKRPNVSFSKLPWFNRCLRSAQLEQIGRCRGMSSQRESPVWWTGAAALQRGAWNMGRSSYWLVPLFCLMGFQTHPKTRGSLECTAQSRETHKKARGEVKRLLCDFASLVYLVFNHFWPSRCFFPVIQMGLVVCPSIRKPQRLVVEETSFFVGENCSVYSLEHGIRSDAWNDRQERPGSLLAWMRWHALAILEDASKTPATKSQTTKKTYFQSSAISWVDEISHRSMSNHTEISGRII